MPVSSFVISTDAPLTELLCTSATLSLSVASVTWAVAAGDRRGISNARRKIRMRGNSFMIISVLSLCERIEKEPKRLFAMNAYDAASAQISKVPLLKRGNDSEFPRLENIRRVVWQSLCHGWLLRAVVLATHSRHDE